jgi:hypothetical protein
MDGHVAKLHDLLSHRSLAIPLGSDSFAQIFSLDSNQEVQLWNKQ